MQSQPLVFSALQLSDRAFARAESQAHTTAVRTRLLPNCTARQQESRVKGDARCAQQCSDYGFREHVCPELASQRPIA